MRMICDHAVSITRARANRSTPPTRMKGSQRSAPARVTPASVRLSPPSALASITAKARNAASATSSWRGSKSTSRHFPPAGVPRIRVRRSHVIADIDREGM